MSGESNGGITIGALATRVVLWKHSRCCEAVIVTMQLINTEIKFKLQSFDFERQANEMQSGQPSIGGRHAFRATEVQ
jgi:hypothetical protein